METPVEVTVYLEFLKSIPVAGEGKQRLYQEKRNQGEFPRKLILGENFKQFLISRRYTATILKLRENDKRLPIGIKTLFEYDPEGEFRPSRQRRDRTDEDFPTASADA